jgi:TolB-like protein/DNA-binding SARP family transcriptional activator/Flp pilus assembly protein TadD
VFRLKLLGGASLTGPSGPLSGRVVQRRQMALLALLGGSRSKPLSRDKVTALLWPESTAANARASLSDTLHVLRKELGEEAIVLSADDLELNGEVVWCDVQAFRGALREGRPEEALSLYAGPFLDGFHFSGSPEFERWADGERDALRREARDAADALAAERETRGDLGGAVLAARWALALEPHDEVAARRLMRLLAAAGDRGGAVEAYEAFARGLQTDLELDPSPETVALAEGIRAGTALPSPRGLQKEPEQPHPSPSPPGVTWGQPSTPDPWQARTPVPIHRGIPSPEAPPAGLASPQPATSGLVRRNWRRPALAAFVILAGIYGAFRLLDGGGSVPPPSSAADHGLPSVAVLPFDNRSLDPAHGYFAGALHDELLTQLSRVRGLKVISRTSIMGYAAAPRSVRDIATALGVSWIVEGSVQVLGDRLRVTVQLIDARTDDHLWAERYDRTLGDAFEIQSDIAHQVVEAVGASLGASELQAMGSPPTSNAEAYLLYLQGLEYDRRPGRTRRDREVAQDLYERALALDSTFALAWAALSEVHGIIHWQSIDPSLERLELQRLAAETALRLSPDLPEAHAAMGSFHYRANRDWQAALEEYQAALENLPNDGWLWERIGYTHRRMGNWDQVSEAFERVLSLDPRNAAAMRDLGALSLEQQRRYAEAAEWCSRALAFAPDYAYADVHRGRIWVVWMGRPDSLGAALDRHPPEADWGGSGGPGPWRALQLLWQRDADSLLALATRTPGPRFDNDLFYIPASLHAAWAHRLLGDSTAAQAAFDSARAVLDSVGSVLTEDWRVHAGRGMALAGLGLKKEARDEARWLERSRVYRGDAAWGPRLAEDRARILAGIGDADEALDEIERLLETPSFLSVHTLRLDPRWDPIREHPRFKELLQKHSAPPPG